MGSKPYWSDEEIGFLIDHSAWTARQVADEISRSAASVQYMRTRLRNGWIPVRQKWSAADLDFVRATTNLTAGQVAGHLQRSESAIKNVRRMLHRAEGLSFDVEGRSKLPHTVGSRTLLAKTCHRCGKFLNATWFGRRRARSRKFVWADVCGRCHHARGDNPNRVSTSARDGGESARKSAARLQAFTRERATHHREPWLSSDHDVLQDPDLTAFEKALQLGRTYLATRQACSANGYHSKVGRGDPIEGLWVIRPIDKLSA